MRKDLQKAVHDTLFELLLDESRPVTEQMIGERLGVSRTPVRQVLKSLEKEGLIEQKRKRGIYLKPMSVEEFSQLYDVRAVIEGFAGRLACRNIVDGDVRELQSFVDEYNREIENEGSIGVDRVDLQFHRRIVEISRNIHLLKIMDDFSILERVFMQERKLLASTLEHPLSPVSNGSAISHEMIIDALRTGNGDECEEIIRLHILHSRQRIVESAMNMKFNPFE